MAWNVVLTGPALIDFADIIGWTTREFGAVQAQHYENLIAACLDNLSDGPGRPTIRSIAGLTNIFAVPLMDGRRRARHILYARTRPTSDGPILQILRILHDSMDPMLHLTPDDPA